MIGKSITRVDAYDKVTGRAKFTDDLTPAGLPCGKGVSRPDRKRHRDLHRHL